MHSLHDEHDQSRVYEYDEDFKLVQSRLLKEANSFLHDFVVTDNYYVFFSVSQVTVARTTRLQVKLMCLYFLVSGQEA